MSIQKPIYDVVGIGLGPFNLGLAAMLDGIEEIDGLFLEKQEEFNWHPGMMIEGTTLQVPFFADLVSLADVRSPYTFLNYLQEKGRLYHFYFLEKFHISRKEYNDYCRWVSEQLRSCHFGKEVKSIDQIKDENGEELFKVSSSKETYFAKNIVMGIGSVPYVPDNLREHLGETVFHTAEYLNHNKTLDNADSITVVGSGQSSAEVFLDLLKKRGTEADLHWYTRSKGFFPMEYSKLGLEYFSPDYTHFFYQLPQEKKDELLKQQDLLYKGISAETIAEIYDNLYEGTVGESDMNVQLQAMSELQSLHNSAGQWKAEGRQLVTNEPFVRKSDVVILGTGYQQALPEFLSPMSREIHWDDQGRYKVEANYQLSTDIEAGIFVQNGEMHTHGVGAPDLGLGAYRNTVIINSLAGREIFPIKDKHVFQTFGTKVIQKQG
ncbi:lysine N(6)-hydroxylase/L-ornithine N(5)-oxygenase family protein [Halobacillus sp. Marseille-Q1614]|uniref:lysine N(6)-hydroxylase/L-ornithine N(5)-oxygenase family protein n=1 Tax=Halobacillus sp. Marseille-Q1614 TaxID=2709134 RepID=UPI00156EA683|nr:lysine N(6)-hydroxylase/L-ornithine N(5)-oxygenase family protein [Halobacillus sp. Marseille-Q1614]